MSGFEVIGVVLGSIPLIISALEHYADGVQATRRLFGYRWELKRYSVTMRTEGSIFRNTSTWLLTGIAGPLEIEKLVENPGGEAWKDERLSQELKKRLVDAYGVFFELVADISDALKEFAQRLGLDDQGHVQLNDKNSLKSAFKAGKIMLSKGSYDDLIARIKEDNRALKELTRQSIQLQTYRRSSRGIAKLEHLRKYASELYQAVGGAFNCPCISKHRAGLNFGTAISDTSNAFRILLSKGTGREATGLDWLPLSVEIVEPDTSITNANPAPISPTVGSSRGVTGRGRGCGRGFKSVSFANFQTPINAASTQVAAVQAQVLVAGKLVAIQDLCRRLQHLQMASIPPSLGLINADTTKFCVKRCETFAQEPSMCPLFLSHVLGGKAKQPFRLKQIDKLNISIALSAAVLSLFQTPWMPIELAKQDIVIIRRQPNTRMSTYIITHLSTSGLLPTTTTHIPAYIENQGLFTLGIILIELLFGMSIEKLRKDVDPSGQSGASVIDVQYAIATRLLAEEQILEEGGVRYENAVRSCIKCNFGPEVRRHDLNNQQFRKAVYDNVIAQLEDFAKEYEHVR